MPYQSWHVSKMRLKVSRFVECLYKCVYIPGALAVVLCVRFLRKVLQFLYVILVILVPLRHMPLCLHLRVGEKRGVASVVALT